eukprot:6178118-Pleurochrysis_carterae.AAC.1
MAINGNARHNQNWCQPRDAHDVWSMYQHVVDTDDPSTLISSILMIFRISTTNQWQHGHMIHRRNQESVIRIPNFIMKLVSTLVVLFMSLLDAHQLSLKTSTRTKVEMVSTIVLVVCSPLNASTLFDSILKIPSDLSSTELLRIDYWFHPNINQPASDNGPLVQQRA